MPVCCRCNGSGRCRNCSCSKAGKPCVDCLPQRKGRCCNESHTSSQTPIQPSSQNIPQASNIPSLGSACAVSQDTQPPTQPSPDYEMAHETSDQRFMVDNSGMSSLTGNNGILGAGPDFLPVFLPEQDQQIPPEIVPSDQITPTPETVSQQPLSQPSNHVLSATPDWPSPALHPPDFCWGSYEGTAHYDAVTTAYNEVIHWRCNVFLVPSGTTGKAFVSELARLMQSYADGSSLESIAMEAGTIAQTLLLQKPNRKSKSKEHVTHLQRRLNLWHKGDIQSLLEEGRCIQKHLHTSQRPSDDQVLARTFCRLMLQGKVYTKSFETPFSKDIWGRAEPGGPGTRSEWEWEWKPNTHAHYS